ncbi:MAG: hypothetical protein IIA90_08270 [Chloroflexi bacterium]|nr:hypothetical protein [Chloroflexota bacterium]
MTLIKRATIKSYDAGTHRASVGISGSLSVWLEGLAVSDSIPAAAVVAGRECAVLFHTDDNPDDAVVVSVHGGGPPASGAGTIIQDADADTKVDVEQSADDDKVRMTVAGAQRFILQNSSPHLTLAGDAWITNNLGVRSAPASDDSIFINCSPTLNVSTIVECLRITPTLDINASSFLSIYAMRGTLLGKASGGGIYNAIIGCDYVTSPWSDGAGTQTVYLTTGLQSAIQTLRTAGTLNIIKAAAIIAYGFNSVLGASTAITDLIGVYIRSPLSSVGNGITNMTGLLIEHIAYGTNKYLIHAFRDATNTSLRLDAGNPPDAALTTEGDSQLYLAWMENGAVNLRQVRWRKQSSLGSADKVLIAA